MDENIEVVIRELLGRLEKLRLAMDEADARARDLVEGTNQLCLIENPETLPCPNCKSISFNARGNCTACGLSMLKVLLDELAEVRRDMFRQHNELLVTLERVRRGLSPKPEHDDIPSRQGPTGVLIDFAEYLKRRDEENPQD